MSSVEWCLHRVPGYTTYDVRMAVSEIVTTEFKVFVTYFIMRVTKLSFYTTLS